MKELRHRNHHMSRDCHTASGGCPCCASKRVQVSMSSKGQQAGGRIWDAVEKDMGAQEVSDLSKTCSTCLVALVRRT